MKVLFAVSNENISEAIIKRYPKEYKEILSYKNVYYFNAILKEIQKDKSYDRIVISEDLEPFVNSNHDSIDNFIFEHLDKISDEAHDNEGKETSIILICSERRAPGSNILNKLFSIGVYNAVMGKDRNLQELCRLINRPRTKKEAKIYYRIDQATYDPVVENEVNEAEIQNILTHFKKLGKNTERYADSFNNIAAQYTDEQLRIIINVLPIKVKAVLESESPKYQSLMGNSTDGNRIKPIENKEPGIKVNTIGKTTQINGPIVIPSSVKKVEPRRVATDVQVSNTNVQPNVVKNANKNVVTVQHTANKSINANTLQQTPIKNETNIAKSQVEVTKSSNIVQNVEPNKIEEEPISTIEVEEEPLEEVKRGRGRPKKIVSETEVQKPKGKRGRPKKNIVDDVEESSTQIDDLNNLLNPIGSTEESEDILPGLEESEEDNALPGLEEIEDVLPGIEETEDVLPGVEEEPEDLLPGLDEEEIDVDNSLPGLDDELEEDNSLSGFEEGEDVDVSELLAGLDDNDNLPGVEETEDVLPGIEEEPEDLLHGLDEEEIDVDNSLPGLDDSLADDTVNNETSEEETILPGMGFEDSFDEETNFESEPKKIKNDVVDTIKPKISYSMSNLNSLLSKDKKIVTFIGTTKNGTSFLVNNLALMFSLMGISTAILDMTQNRNSYYIFTDSREELRNIAYTSIGKLENGYSEGIKVNKNLTVYTALPSDGNKYENAEPILSTLVQNHSLVLIDCDFETPPAYFASAQEIYLVQSMDILTIQPLTAFLRELKFKGAWEPEKARVVINKETKVRGLNGKLIIAGMSRYNGPDMSVMTDLFNRDMVKACTIPFDEKVYAKYLETMATCKLSLSGYSKQFMQKMQILGDMVYPRLNSKKTYGPMDNANINNTNNNVFSNDMNNTLNQMKNKF